MAALLIRHFNLIELVDSVSARGRLVRFARCAKTKQSRAVTLFTSHARTPHTHTHTHTHTLTHTHCERMADSKGSDDPALPPPWFVLRGSGGTVNDVAFEGDLMAAG